MPKRLKKSGGTSSWPIDEEPESTVAFEMIDSFTSPTVCLTLGKSKTTYHLHREILTKRCPYFESAFHFHEVKDDAEVEQLCLLDDCDHPEAFKIFIMYLYLSRYEVPSGISEADACILHAQVYVLAVRLCMDDLKTAALKKMSLALREGHWGRSFIELKPETVIELLQTIYSGTQDHRRWPYPSESGDGEVFGKRQACSDQNGVSIEASPGEEALAIGEAQPGEDTLLSALEALVPEQEPELDEEPEVGEEPVAVEEVSEPDVARVISEPELVGGQETQDEMRQLISNYVASKLKYLRSDAKFMAELVKGGAIVADVIAAIQ